MKGINEYINWIDNPFVKKAKILIISLMTASVLSYFLILFYLIKINSSIIFFCGMILISFLGVTYYISFKRNVPIQVGFSRDGTYFLHGGKDKYIHWHEIDSIKINDQFLHYPEIKLKNGQVLVLGFIDKNIIKEMIKRTDEFTRARSEQVGEYR